MAQLTNTNTNTAAEGTMPYVQFKGVTVNTAERRSFLEGAFNAAERAELLNENFTQDFDTYRNWGDFSLFLQGDNATTITADGKRSLFNAFSGVTKMGITYNVPLIDGQDGDGFATKDGDIRRRETDCTVKRLVEDSQAGLMGIAYYSYADFMYCKDLGKISNNHMITLRRFAYPCSDEILNQGVGTADEHSPDIGRLVGWFGTEDNKLEDILKYSVGMNWKNLKAEIQQVDGNADNSAQGVVGKVLNTFLNKEYAQGAMAGTVETHNLFGKYSPGGPYSGAEWLRLYDENKVYGPVNVIDETNIRERGLKFDQTITLTFDYELRSYDGINPRAALTDMVANILAVCGNTGRFWGGSVHFIGPSGSNGFQHLKIYNASTPEQFIDGLGKDISQGLSMLMGAMKNPSNLLTSAKSMLSNAASILMGGMLNKLGRPNKYALKSLLDPSPTGLWHLTIGNPKNPILQIGNLIMDNAEIQHYGPLGFDDFPTGLKVTVTLKHGKPRDIAGVEHMYTMGRDRIYTPMSEKISDMYSAAPGSQAAQTGTTKDGANTRTFQKRDSKGGQVNIKYMFENNLTNQKGMQKYFGAAGGRILPSAKEML